MLSGNRAESVLIICCTYCQTRAVKQMLRNVSGIIQLAMASILTWHSPEPLQNTSACPGAEMEQRNVKEFAGVDFQIVTTSVLM